MNFKNCAKFNIILDIAAVNKNYLICAFRKSASICPFLDVCGLLLDLNYLILAFRRRDSICPFLDVCGLLI